ncbi:hypothetical protein POJ06DRAFT_241829 [Lipomyces tetrasporus]|uniref:Uncharacterized protein n=1 Tax=Lipomyces tetrasporus TaxID=54092 RepID=A0AAD7VVU8_9ASCO|nr:uncharacterized protein POJ06DRAFT_241829 [Lipomyces tetrasporus]KAJ8103421.1 hypothetical protein POJ06DRAFT_241829 [Lipomyces tetrasporus]
MTINHFSQLNNYNRIISLWIAAERVLECGSLWAFSLTSLLRMITRVAMSPILKVSNLLASFAARWNGCVAYVDSWETLLGRHWWKCFGG